MMSSRTSARKKKNRRAFLNLLLIVALIAGVTLSLTVFFKIDTIEVNGNSPYSDDQIISASGIKLGGNLFRFNATKREKHIWDRFSYIDDVNIIRKIPSTIIIEVTACDPCGTIKTDKEYVTFSQSLKVVSEGSLRPDNVPLVIGWELEKAVLGKPIESNDLSGQAAVCDIIAGLGDGLLEKVSLIDVSNRLDLRFVYDSRILVTVGTASDVEYKLEMFAYIVSSPDNQTLNGYIDVSTPGEASVGADDELLSREYPEYY